MRRIPPLILILCMSAAPAFSQGEIPVDMYTGQPSITVPLTIITCNDISQPVVLTYSANSVAANSPFGPGWSISAGSVTREVRTYPDDVGYNLTTKGWFYQNPSSVLNATDIGNFVPAADDSTAWDPGEGTDHTKINGLNYTVDTEPDVFHYNAGGISGSFVFDNALGLRTIPYADVVITPTYTSGSDRKITSFTITTNNGFVYTFGHIVSASRSTAEDLYANRSYYLTTEYEMYNPSVTYTREWKLTRIDSPTGAYITYTYTNISDSQTSNAEIGLYQYPDPVYANPSDIIQNTAYKITEISGRADITSVTGSTGSKAEFSYSGGTLQTVTLSDTRRGTTAEERKVKSFSFEYLPVTYTYDNYADYPNKTVQFLKSVTENSGCEKLPPHEFNYTGLFTLTGLYYKPGTFLLSPRGSDQWGNPNSVANNYPFPKLYIYPAEPMVNRYRTSRIPGYTGDEFIVPGANRGSIGSTGGILQSISSPEGGVTEFVFESNNYFDPHTNQTGNAGGLRIRRISYHDGFNQTPIVKTFEYVDPDTGLSSGRLIRMPALAIPSFTWKSPGGASHDKMFATSGLTTEQKYQYLLIRRESDQSPGETTQGNTVGYKIVTVSRPGAGYARFEFLLPAAHGDAATGDWTPTVNKFARNASGVDMGIIDGANTWGFPFSPNPNYDFERGLISKKSDYTSNDKLVQQTITTYKRLYKSGTTPYKVWGLKYDRYPGSNPANKIFFYGRYYLLTDAINVPAKEVTIRFDLTDTTGNTRQKDSVEYLYESTAHKLLTQVKRYTADGNLYTTRIKYPKDYTTNASGAADAVAIHTMKSNNRHSMPIETIQTFKKAGNDSVWVIGGSVVKLDPFGGSRIMVRSVWSLKASPPVYYSSFNQSAVVNSSGYKFKIDPRYERTDSILSYTSFGTVKASYSPVSRKTAVTGYGYTSSIPVVQLMNVRLNGINDIQAGFSDFETTTGYEFTADTSYYGTGRTGLKAFYPKKILKKVVTRAPDVSTYILGFWVKSNTTFTLKVTLRPAAGGAAYSTVNVSVPNTSSEYQYIQQAIPLTGVPAAPATFRVDLQASSLSAPPANNPPIGGTSASLLNVIDDVFFYPENADMVATTYQLPYGATSVTSGTGATTYTEYDPLGRPRIVYDKDRNIVKRNVYQYIAQSPLTADFSISGVTLGETTTFTAATNDCVTDATYEWDIGAGFTSGTAVKTHTFDTLGIHTVKLRVTSAAYGTQTTTKSFTSVTSPFTINICAKGAIYFSGGVPDLFGLCQEITADPPGNGVIFRVSTLASVSAYQWQTRDLGSATWVNIGSPGPNADQHLFKVQPDITYSSYEVRCRVTTNSGGVGFSPTMQVIFEN